MRGMRESGQWPAAGWAALPTTTAQQLEEQAAAAGASLDPGAVHIGAVG